LYCINDPINRCDPKGLWTVHIVGFSMVSAGWSAMSQMGFVMDGQGNIGVIGMSSMPLHEDDEWGIDLGWPAATMGVAIGFSNANTVYDLIGTGFSMGGSVSTGALGLNMGIDFFFGRQQNSHFYHGFETTYGVGLGFAEAHFHSTNTTVSAVRHFPGLKRFFSKFLLEKAYNAKTVGQGYVLLSAWGLLD